MEEVENTMGYAADGPPRPDQYEQPEHAPTPGEPLDDEALLDHPVAGECRARILWGEKPKYVADYLETVDEPIILPEQIELLIEDAQADRKETIIEAGKILLTRGAYCAGIGGVILIFLVAISFLMGVNTSIPRVFALLLFAYGVAVGALGYRRFKSGHVDGNASKLTGFLG